MNILPSNQTQIIEQAKFTYSLFRKGFEKQTNITEDQGKKQVDTKRPKDLETIKDNKSDDNEKLLKYNM